MIGNSLKKQLTNLYMCNQENVDSSFVFPMVGTLYILSTECMSWQRVSIFTVFV